MRKIILFIASSLDDYIARKDGNIDWLFHDHAYGYKKFYKSIDTVVMGRKTYEKALEFEKEPYKDKKCYVFSRSKNKKTIKNVKFVDDVENFSKRLIKSKGKGIWLVGGSEIISIFINKNLLDEIRLYVHPIILGNGIPLFNGIKQNVKLKFIKSKSYKSGLVQLHYKILK